MEVPGLTTRFLDVGHHVSAPLAPVEERSLDTTGHCHPRTYSGNRPALAGVSGTAPGRALSSLAMMGF